MTFSYQTLTNPVTSGYVAGALVQSALVMSSIQVSSSGSLIKNYVLGDSTSATTGRQTLVSVKECADAGASNCLAPTTFAYKATASGTTTTATPSVGAYTVDGSHDFNGDGFADLYYTDGTGSHVAFGSLSGFGTPVSANVASQIYGTGDLLGTGKEGLIGNNAGTFYYYTWNGSSFVGTSTGATVPSTNNQTYTNQVLVTDVNGDGLQDIVYSTFYTTTAGNYTIGYLDVYVLLNTGTAGSLSFSSPILAYSYATQFLRTANVIGGTQFTPNQKRHGLDFNGDGRNDLAVQLGLTTDPTCSNNCVTTVVTDALLSTGSTFAVSQLNSQSAATFSPVWFLDFNNDRCTDYLAASINTFNNPTLFVASCNGAPATTINVPYITANVTPTVVGIIDWNGDGLMDVLVNNGGTIGIYASLGNSLGPLISTSIPYNAGAQYFKFDADGDGLDDLGVLNQGAVTFYLHNSAGQAVDLLNVVTDGYGNFAKPTYIPITQGNYIQTPGLTPSYPYRAYRGPQYVVSRVTFNDPTSTAVPQTTYYQSYSYADEWSSLNGRGLTGMRSRQIYDSRNALWTTTLVGSSAVGQAFPFTGFPYRSMVAQDSAATVLASSHLNTSSVDTILDATANNQRHMPYIAASIDKTYEVGGTKNGLLVKTATLSNTVDTHGNSTQATVTTQDNDAGSPYLTQTWTRTTTNTPYYDSTNCGILLSQSQVSYTASNASPASVTRTKAYTPDTAHCRYSQVITEPSSATYKVTESLAYDNFGNIQSDAITGVNMPASPATRSVAANWGITGQFLMTLTDPVGVVTTWSYTSAQSLGYGRPDSVTDANGVKMAYQYDPFGRKLQAQSYDSATVKGPGTIWSYSLCSGCDALPKMIVNESPTDTSGNVIRTDVHWYDMWDRPFRIQKTRVDGVQVWSQNLTFDALSRVTNSAMPYVQGTPVGGTSYSYDAVNRLTQSSRPTSTANATPATTLTAYQGDTTLRTDAVGHTTTTLVPADGQVHQTLDANGYAVIAGYDAAGTQTSVSDSLGNPLTSATYAYGVAAFKLQSTDMDLGTWRYTVDALGELTGWQDANGQSFTATYDALSRPVTRTEPDSAATWVYGSSAASHNFGRLQCVLGFSGSSCASTGSGYREDDAYDSLGRPQTRTIAEDVAYTIGYSYNSLGLPNTLSYPTSTNGCNVTLQYGYQYGLAKSISDVSNSSACGTSNGVLWQANAVNPRQQVTQEAFGNGVLAVRAMDGVTGLPSAVQAGVGGGTTVQNESYLFDALGNMTQRQDNNAGLTESFYYDAVNRLDYSTLGSAINLQMHYDALGNITSRSDVAAGASWVYDPNRKHAVLQAGSSALAYTYDANGNAITRNGYAITWMKSNYPSVINTNGKSVSLSYAPDRSHYQQLYISAGVSNEVTQYVGGILEKVTVGGMIDWRHYVRVGNETVAVIDRSNGGTNAIRYVLADPLGSVDKVTDSTGTPYVAESYCPYGAKRNGATWSGAASCADLGKMKLFSREGFTGQDMIGGNSMELIHMNGRVEDAITGRFLSADPYVTQPGLTQNYNRYSYVLNDPLSNADPSGFGCIVYRKAPGTQPDSTETGVNVDMTERCYPDGDPPEDFLITATKPNDCGDACRSYQDPRVDDGSSPTGPSHGNQGDGGGGPPCRTGVGCRVPNPPLQTPPPPQPPANPYTCARFGLGCDPAPPPPPPCPNGGTPARINNPNIGKYTTNGLIGGVAIGGGAALTGLVINVYGFPEVELGEGALYLMWVFEAGGSLGGTATGIFVTPPTCPGAGG